MYDLLKQMNLMTPDDGDGAGAGGYADGAAATAAAEAIAATAKVAAANDGEDGKQGKGGAAESPKTTEPVVPETYDLKWTKFESPVSKEFIEGLAPGLKAANVGQEDAQALIDMFGDELEHQQAAKDAARDKEWAKACSTDEKYGGAKFVENAERAKNIVNRLFGEDFKTFLNETGLGNHPEMFVAMNIIADAVSEDRLGAPGNHGGKPTAEATRAEQLRAMYPTMHSGDG